MPKSVLVAWACFSDFLARGVSICCDLTARLPPREKPHRTGTSTRSQAPALAHTRMAAHSARQRVTASQRRKKAHPAAPKQQNV